MKLWNFLKEHIVSHPEQQICEDEARISFEDALIWAEMYSKQLKGCRCCAVLCQSEMVAAMSLLACFAAEVTAVPLSYRYGKVHCQKILDRISPDAIIMDDGDEVKVYRIKDSQFVSPEVYPSLIMCTSGTTGTPKGTMLSEKNIITNVTDILDYFPIDESDAILIARPLYHCAVLVGEFLAALVAGTSIRFYSQQFNPAKILDLIKKYDITTFCGTPTLVSMMARFQRSSSPKELRQIVISGECLSRETAAYIANEFSDCDIYHVYGLTEACPRVTYLPPQQFREYSDCVGIPLQSVSIRLVNAQGEDCVTNEEGILWVKGDNVMLGYYQEPEKTEMVLKDGWLCTGDIAIVNDAGLLKIKGRQDDLIIKSGMNIYPSEVENMMKADRRVKEIIVYGFVNQFGTQVGMKVVGDFATIEEVKQLCISVLPSYEIPSKIELCNKLPQNGSGKVIRRLLL